MSDKTPGQAAYETAYACGVIGLSPWDTLPPMAHARWAAIAQAAIEAHKRGSGNGSQETMSLPQTDQEQIQFNQTCSAAAPTENVVSTACPVCSVRFAMVAKFYADVTVLRCTLCGWTGKGELKT